MSDQDLLSALRAAVGESAVRTDDAARELAASDIHHNGALPLAVVRPGDAAGVAAAVAAATGRGYAVLPRGGGLSYTGGYAPPHARSITLDLAGLGRILAIADDDLVITVQAGVTWRQIHAALQPRGLRLPYFGTFSGAGATVGGGLSHGALFFGSARYGSVAENVVGLEVVLADGTRLRTGQGALAAGSKPFLRSFGPDLTGLFVHDGGAFGIKTEASLRLIRTPAHYGYASFAFADLATAADALSAVARADVAEEAYVLDPVTVAAGAEASAGQLARSALAVIRAAGGPGRALAALWSLARGGRGVIPAGCFSLHLVAAGRSAAAIAADLASARRLASDCGGREVEPTVPRVARAELFPALNAVLDRDGGRWAALNAKVAHSDARALIAGYDRLLAKHAGSIARHGIVVTRLASALGNHAFSFEPVFHWHDRWQPLHRQAADPAHLATLTEPAANPAARALVDQLRAETVEYFRSVGAASNQIGRMYPFLEALSPAPAALLRQIKSLVDPAGLVNPGVLGLG